MFGRKAILPIDIDCNVETSTFQEMEENDNENVVDDLTEKRVIMFQNVCPELYMYVYFSSIYIG
jgi:hypothetical protein